MKSLSFVFKVFLYFVIVHYINCAINNDNSEIINFTKKEKFSINFVNKVFQRNSSSYIENETVIKEIIEMDINNNEEKGHLCLRNISNCMETDDQYKLMSEKFSKFIFSTTPPFDLSQIKGVSDECRKHSRMFIEDLGNFKLWALKMYDSSAKLPSGILNGNINQLGDFDMCLQVNEEKTQINGQYCLASMQIEASSSPYLSALHRLIHSHSHFKSQLDDPGHRVPRFSSINWALCVPSSCSPRDVELGLKKNLKNLFENTDFTISTKVDPIMCQKNESYKITNSTIIALIVFIGIISIAIIATFNDVDDDNNKKNDLLNSFSLKRNYKSLISTKRSSDDIEAIHGIRFVNAILLLLAHKSMAIFFIPFVNRTEMVEFIAKPWTVLGRAASLYTDPFIMISGTLTTYALLGRLDKTKKLQLFQEYVSRLLRILPTFAALIAFCTFILPYLNSGPMWNLVVSQHSDICKKYWWRNLLFIHNYFGFKDMCLTHTHHVGIDTQLFFSSPFLIWILWKWPKNGAKFLIFLATVSTIWRYYITYTMKLSNYIHFGTSIKQLFETADKMYILPIHRSTVYILGILLGYILKNYRNTILTNTQIQIGNYLALLSFIISFFGPAFMGSINYRYNPIDAAFYAAFAPIFWCFSFAWIIFTSHTGYKGLLEKFFSLSIFSIWTKISYTVYLTQFPVYFFNVGTTRTSQYFGFFGTMFGIKEYAWIILLSTLLTLLVEMPFQNIRNLIFNKNKNLLNNVIYNEKHKKIS